MVAFPYWMANMGHLWRQARHITHLFSVMTGLLFSIFIALIGQYDLHSPQPSHISVTQNILVFWRPYIEYRGFAIRAEVASGMPHPRLSLIPATMSSMTGSASRTILSTLLLSDRSCIGVQVWGMTTRNIPSTRMPLDDRPLAIMPPAFPGDEPQVTATKT